MSSPNSTPPPQGGRLPADYQLALALAPGLRSRLRYVQAERRWYVCSDTREPGYWTPEKESGSTKLVAEAISALTASFPSLNKVNAVRTLLQPHLAAEPKDFDRWPWLLGCLNGVVDLKTGAFTQPVDPDLLLTRHVPITYDPQAACPTWLDHLRVLTRTDESRTAPGDPELAAYLQELVGVSLVGRQVEHAFVYLHGDGRNGKGVFLDTLQHVLGDAQDYGYADALDQTVLFSRPDAHTTGQADLQGVRLVVADEVTGRLQINTALLKKLTGGGRLKARRMRQDNVTFEPSHILWLASNDPPNFGVDQTDALWERVVLIETGPTIPQEQRLPDDQLRERLRAEAPGILAWAVEGAVRYAQRGKLPPRPRRVVMVTQALRSQLDLVQQFLDVRCEEAPDARVLLSTFRQELVRWAEGEGLLSRRGPEEPLSSHAVSSLLRRRKIVVEKGAKNQTFVKGWRLQPLGLGDQLGSALDRK